MRSPPGGLPAWRPWIVATLVAVIPVAVWLAVQAQRARSFLVLPDELLYVELAQALAIRPLEGLDVYGTPTTYTNGIYPALLAPLYALFDTGTAFTGAHVLNGVLFASTAIPVVLLLRHLGASPWLGALGGLLATCVPWATTTTVLMTEAAAYPAFAWAVFAMTVAVSAPSVRHDVLALLSIVVTVGVRTQFVLLLVVLVVAILTHAATYKHDETSLRRALAVRLRPHLPVAIALAVLALFLLTVGPDIFGAYGETTSVARLPEGMIIAATEYAARLSTGLTIIPMVLGLAFFIRGLARPATPTQYAFALVGALSALLVLYEAAAFTRIYAGWSHERYAAYAVIPLAVATVALLADVRRPPPVGTLLVSGVAVAIVGSAETYEPGLPLPGWMVLAPSQGFDEVWAGRFERLNGLVPGGPHPPPELLAATVVVITLILAAALALRRRSAVAAAVLLVVLALNVYETQWALDRGLRAVNTEAAANAAPDRTWVDDVAGDRRVAVIAGRLGLKDDRDQWVSLQYWNTSVQRLYAPPAGSTAFLGLATPPLDVDAHTGALREPIEAPLAALAADDPNLGLAGSVLTRRRSGVALVELARPQRLTRLLLGVDADGDTAAGKDAELRLYPPLTSSSVELTLEAPPARKATRWEVRSGKTVRRGVLEPSRSVTTRLPVTPSPGAPYVSFRIHTPDTFTQLNEKTGLRVVGLKVR